MKTVIFMCIVSLICISSVSLAQWTARTSQDPLGDGTTTRFSDGTSARTRPNPLGDGTTTRFDDGSIMRTTPSPFGGGSTTRFYDSGY